MPRVSVADRIMHVYRTLLAHFGPQHWWPGETPFEVMVGAILTQNTAWTNVEKAIVRLKTERVLAPDRLLRMSPDRLADLIRPSGYFNIKAKRLQSFLRWFVEEHDADENALRALPLDVIRPQLLAVNGVGPETADSILLYAFGQPTFVVDVYTRRIFHRLGLCGEDEPYEALRALFMRNLPVDVALYNEYHALIVALGKYHCSPKPRCTQCPLSAQRHRRGARATVRR